MNIDFTTVKNVKINDNSVVVIRDMNSNVLWKKEEPQSLAMEINFTGTTFETKGAIVSTNGITYSVDGGPQQSLPTTAVIGVGGVPNEPHNIKIYGDITQLKYHFIYNQKTVTSVIIYDSNISLPESGFEGCTNLTSVIIPDGVTSIPIEMFKSCTSLGNITIPDSVTSIGKYCFYKAKCTNLTLPNNNVTYGINCFDSFQTTSVTIPKGTLDKQCFNYSTIKSVVIGNGVTSIGEQCFANCQQLANITFNSPITEIPKNCFNTCTALTNLNFIPNTVTKLGDSAFKNCTGFTTITIPSGVITIDDSCFSGCSKITNVTFPSSVRTINENSFYYSGTQKTMILTFNGKIAPTVHMYTFNTNAMIRIYMTKGYKSVYQNAFYSVYVASKSYYEL